MFLCLVLFMCFAHSGVTCAAEYQKAHDTLFRLIGQSCITSPDNGATVYAFSQFLHRHKCTSLSLNSGYYVHYIQLHREPFTLLAYACYSVTCDHRIVFELCSAGADPNHKYEYGLYPATYVFKSLIRLYPTRDERAHYVKNQVQKLSILNDTIQLDSFVTIDADDNSQNDEDVHLAVDRCVIKLITPEIKVWLKQLLEHPVAPLNFESKNCAYKLQ